jgi:hypothetical protein
MRALTGLFCAVAITACLAPGVRADEYTKQTFLTFSGPVQLPGITLPAGTYQFRLADPDSGRRTLQVWDKDGTKLYTTLLTIPDRRSTVSDKPVVMFTERPSGQAQAIREWFYPDEIYGQEFVYPKAQAMKIAQESHSPVLSFNDDTKADEAAYKSAKIGRVDENGKMSDADTAATTASNNTSADRAQSASTTTADNARANTAAQSSTAQSDNSQSQTARADTSMPPASANRSGASPSAVGTSGTTGSTANSVSANRTAQAASGANAAAPRANTAPSTSTAPNANRQLPRTASTMPLVELLAALSLAAAFALRVFRVRTSESQ